MTRPVTVTLLMSLGKITVTSPLACDVGAVTVLTMMPGVDVLTTGGGELVAEVAEVTAAPGIADDEEVAPP